MTKKYNRTFSNSVTCRLKITIHSGRIPAQGRFAARTEAPSSKIEVAFSADTFPEDAEAVQAECDAFFAECARDVGRLAGGQLTFKAAKIPLYEVPTQNEAGALDANASATTETRADGKGEAIPQE